MSQNILNIKTPTQDQATKLKSEYDLSNLGLRNLNNVYWNLPAEALYEEIVFRSYPLVRLAESFGCRAGDSRTRDRIREEATNLCTGVESDPSARLARCKRGQRNEGDQREGRRQRPKGYGE